MVDRVIVDVDLSDIQTIFHGIERRVRTFPMSILAEGLSNAIEEEIESEGQGSWERLSPNTLKRRPRRVGGKLLQDRGLLANIQSAEGPDWAEAASPAPYAGFHVTGTKWMPPRDWTDVNMDSVLEQFVEEVLEYAVRS